MEFTNAIKAYEMPIRKIMLIFMFSNAERHKEINNIFIFIRMGSLKLTTKNCI